MKKYCAGKTSDKKDFPLIPPPEQLPPTEPVRDQPFLELPLPPSSQKEEEPKSKKKRKKVGRLVPDFNHDDDLVPDYGNDGDLVPNKW